MVLTTQVVASGPPSSTYPLSALRLFVRFTKSFVARHRGVRVFYGSLAAGPVCCAAATPRPCVPTSRGEAPGRLARRGASLSIALSFAHACTHRVSTSVLTPQGPLTAPPHEISPGVCQSLNSTMHCRLLLLADLRLFPPRHCAGDDWILVRYKFAADGS